MEVEVGGGGKERLEVEVRLEMEVGVVVEVGLGCEGFRVEIRRADCGMIAG